MTNEEIKKFWEWCGFTILKEKEWDLRRRARIGFIYPNGGRYTRLPSLDLNNLFKWAVPKVVRVHGIGRKIQVRLISGWGDSSGDYGVEIIGMGKRLSLAFSQDPAIALFRAIQKVKEGV